MNVLRTSLTDDEFQDLVSDYKERGYSTKKAMVVHALETLKETRHDSYSERLAVVDRSGLNIRRLI